MSARTVDFNLHELLSELVASEDGIIELYAFGSRAYGTGSLRSDCDVLVRADQRQNVKASSLRDFALGRCPALDLFLCTDARAVSTANDSFVRANSFEDLVAKLDAVRLWTRIGGFSDFAFPTSGTWIFQTSAHVNFDYTTLPDKHIADLAWQRKIGETEAEDLPILPFIGDTLDKAAAYISDISRRMIFQRKELGQCGVAKDGWTVNLSSEYDCQNLFFTVVKPWLPELGREEITIKFDDQEKHADFSLFEGRLVIEMKYIDSLGKKNEVVKTLDGLSRFYSRNRNIGCLLMILYVRKDVQLDEARWEAVYTFRTSSPQVLTMVVRIP